MAASSSSCGRSRREDIWRYFRYSPLERKTECVIEGEAGRCNHRLGGKNTTNLKRHLKNHHAEIFSKIPETRFPKTKPVGAEHDGEQLSIQAAFAPDSKYKAKPVDAEHDGGKLCIPAAFAPECKYKVNSLEQRAKEQAIALWIGRTGLPASTVEDEDFILMMETLDKRVTIPKRTKINNLLDSIYNEDKRRYKERLAAARRVTIVLDTWTKKGLNASFLAVSACFFCTEENEAKHILLNLDQIGHPCSAEGIKASVDKCLKCWELPPHKILTVIADDGSSMAAAFGAAGEEDAPSSSDTEVSDAEDSDVVGGVQRFGAVDQTPCVAQALQQVVNLSQKDLSINRLLCKVRVLVRLFRTSPAATERLLELSQQTLVEDCPARWSSTYLMTSRLLQAREPVVRVAEAMSWEHLAPGEWQRLAALRDLLFPFAEHSRVLQSDTQSLSLVVPALLDLQRHLAQFSHSQGSGALASLAKAMKDSMAKRFGRFLDPTHSDFSPLAAAACFLDPTVAPEALLDPEKDDKQIGELLRKAEDYIAQLAPEDGRSAAGEAKEEDETAAEEEEEPRRRKRPRFRFLSKPARPSSSGASQPGVRDEIQRFREQLLTQSAGDETALEFWAALGGSAYPSLKPIALDLLAMPASRAFADRVFGVTAELTFGRRNRARVILERSVFLRLNRGR